jgi:threonylcarbamoyladenosine tRNA methylthiotransferase MtaB
MKNFFIYTFGCKVNQYETQIIREQFINNGYNSVDSINMADLVIINSCTVTDQSDRQCNSLINKLLLKKVEIILTGCYAKISKEKILKEFPTITVIQKNDLLKNITQTIKSFDNHSRAFIKIQDGCNSFCSYCIVPYARPVMWSKPVQDIINEINFLLDNGYTEIVLTGIHLGKYDNGIANLLKQIFSVINKEFRIRLSSIAMNEVDNNLIELMKNDPIKLCNHLHISLQSGSDNVLKQMNRKYTIYDFHKTLEHLKNTVKDIAITTDIICGFPTETENDFNNTYNFLNDNKFARLHVFPYSKREGTKAFDLKQISNHQEITGRVSKLLELDKTLRNEFYSKFIGTVRKAVALRGNKALTDNYLTIKNVPHQKGIFDVIIQ